MPLASGGMGEIFLARLEGIHGFEKQCVIKKILPHLTREVDFVTRFVNEAKTLVQLQHGSIAQVLDMGLHEGEPFLALEFVDGKDLRKIAARARERSMPLPLTFVLYTMGRVLDALAYAHRKRDEEDREIGLVHRDVSPQNILVSYEGEVKVIDFGLAKSTLNAAHTNPSIVLGKFLYMSPEQARHAKVDRRTDLYSVGLCLYELVAGQNPFDDVAPGELMAKVASPSIPNIQQVEPLCPGPVAVTLMKALAVDPAQRYQTAEEFRARLMSVLVDIDPTAGPESCSRFMREAFSAEFNSERKLLASLREQRVAPPPPPVASREPEILGSKKEVSTAVRTLTEMPKREVLTEPKAGLSFAPTPRLKEDAGRPARTDRETMPSINLALASLPPQVEPKREPVTMPGQFVPIVGELIDPISVLIDTPWSTTEPTNPAGVAFEPPVITSEPSQTFEPGRLGGSLEGRRVTAPLRPVTAPLPTALKNKTPDLDPSETTGKTVTRRFGFMWVVVPVLAVLGGAGFVLFEVYQDEVFKTLRELDHEEQPPGPRPIGDGRAREPKPAVVIPIELEPVAPVPAVEPAAAPLPSTDGELAPLTPTPVPAKAPTKRRVRQR